MPGYALLCALLLGLVLLGAAGGRTDDDRVRALLLFLGLLPLANAVFDYGSVGLTRWLLRLGTRAGRGRAALFGALDLGAALVAFHLLGCTLIVLVHLMNTLAQEPLLDLGRLFAELGDEARRGDYVWLWAMVFSTFLPTVLHVAVACTSLVALVPQRHRDAVQEWMTHEERDWLMATGVVAGSAALVTASLVAPLALLAWAVASWAPGLGDWYLWVFEQVAIRIGAAVPDRPEPPILAPLVET